jgi:mutator protein MutT
VALSVAIALIERDGLWLVDRRRTEDEFDGLWEFPGGKVLPGETASDAAIRECAEEVGLVIVPRWELATVHHLYCSRAVALHPVICHAESGQARPLLPEIAEVRWVTCSALGSLAMPAANKAVIERLVAWERNADARPAPPAGSSPEA